MTKANTFHEEQGSASILRTWAFLFLLATHAYLGVLLRSIGTLATLHAVLVGIVALFFALRDKTPERIYLMMGYVVGSEILWRMTRADIFWMYAEYLVIVLAIVTIVRFHRTTTGIRSSVIYMALLLTSVPMTLSLPFEIVRKGLAFNLAGPVAFGLSVYSASRFSLPQRWLAPIAFASVLPVVSVAVLATLRVAAGGIVFSSQSSHAASGGYAPNQVSTLMSYASVILFTLVIMKHQWVRYKPVFGTLMLYISAQGILTFSRGGLLNTVAFLTLFLPFLLRDRKTRLRVVGLAIILLPLINFVVAPEIEHLTGTALEERYSTSGTTTGRSTIIREELDIFMESPILGVGPGMSTYLRLQRYGSFKATTHTEYTRLLAEHGVVGVIAFLFFLATYMAMYSRSKYPRAQGFVLAALAWSLTMFVHAATRTLSFAFLAVLAVLWVQAVDDREDGDHVAGS